MIVRVALAVVTATALLAASAPAMSTARADRADATMDRQLSALSDRLESLAARDDATPEGSARRVLTVRIPARTLTTAAVDRLSFRTQNGNGVATWRVADRNRDRELLADLPVRPDGGKLVLRDTGPHRLAFTLVTDGGERAVTVRRLESAGGTEP